MKYNLLEIRTKEAIKVCPLSRLESFKWINFAGDTLTFVNSQKIAAAKTLSVTGLLEILVKGTATLLTSYQTEVLPPTYVTGLDVGRKESKIEKKIVYYIAIDNHLCPASKKEKCEACFGEWAGKVMDYARQNHLKFTRRTDLIRMVEYYNRLIVSKP